MCVCEIECVRVLFFLGHVCACLSIRACGYVYVCACICVFVQVCVIHTHTHARTHIRNASETGTIFPHS